MRLSHRTLIFLAGAVWLCIGVMLFWMGLHFILETVRNPLLCQIPGKFSIISLLETFVPNRTQAVMLCLILMLILGYIKGRIVLAKTVKRQIKRIESLPNPAPLSKIYGKAYYLLIALMIILGMLLRIFPFTLDTRGMIDTVIGSALMNGSMLYFRAFANYGYLKKKEL